MGLSRRKFTREMKLAAIQRLEAGSSAAEVARAFEINPNVLHLLAEGVPAWSRQCVSRSGKAALG
jgi:transposase-like protein